MKIALLCPGPSLNTLYAQATTLHDLIIGVNTAAWLYPCDVCCCADKHIVDGFLDKDGHIDGNSSRWVPNIFITHRAMPLPVGCERVLMPLGLQANPKGDLRCRYTLSRDVPQDACAYSFPNALAYAQSLKPESIDIYGFDCSPQSTDAAGVEGDHHLNRWHQELPWVKHSLGYNCHIYSMLPMAVAFWLRQPEDDSANTSSRWIDALASLAPTPVWITK